MVKVVPFRFKQYLVRLTCCFTKSPLKGDFWEIWLTTFFGVRNFGNTSAMKVIFFRKCWEFTIAFANAAKNWESVFSFWDRWIWIGYLKLTLLKREYFPSAVNVWRNSLKNLHMTKRGFFELNSFQSNQWIWKRWCRSDFNSVSSPLPCCLSKDPLKR